MTLKGMILLPRSPHQTFDKCAEDVVPSGVITASRLATIPTRRSPSFVNAKAEGVDWFDCLVYL